MAAKVLAVFRGLANDASRWHDGCEVPARRGRPATSVAVNAPASTLVGE